MSAVLCISVRFLQPYAHGRDDNDNPEWPPSPLRLLQALAAASAGRWNQRGKLNHAAAAIRWLESVRPSQIVAADAVPSATPYRLYVPDNVADKAAAAWARGRDASTADYRVEKDVRPSHLAGDSVHYLYELPSAESDCRAFVDILKQAARSITHLGWGIDMVVGDCCIITSKQAEQIHGVRWCPTSKGGTPLRVPRAGTLDDLDRRYAEFLSRVTDTGFRPVPPLRVFAVVRYRRQDQAVDRPWRVFELRNTDGSRFRYSHRKLIHIAGMVRYLAIRATASKALLEKLYPDHDQSKDPFRDGSPPASIDNPDDWVTTYVAGHGAADVKSHRQLSYLPLPSVGHEHADPGVRRVMIVAPIGDEVRLDHIARCLAGQALKPELGKPDPFAGDEPPILVPMPKQPPDGVVRYYTEPANVWHSFTPVILPGHDDRKPSKTKALIERALLQSGIDQACEFEWSPFSRFPKSYSAHKHDRQKRLQGYIRPSYLNGLTTVHLTLRFKNNLLVPGPIVIGAGRHCGFGLMANGDSISGE